MGFANFGRDRKKSVSIAVSLSLGGILLLVVSSMVLTQSPEHAARLFFPDGDYKIYLSSEQPEEEIMAAGNPLDENLRKELLSMGWWMCWSPAGLCTQNSEFPKALRLVCATC